MVRWLGAPGRRRRDLVGHAYARCSTLTCCKLLLLLWLPADQLPPLETELPRELLSQSRLAPS